MCSKSYQQNNAPLVTHYFERLKVSDNWLEKAMIMALIELCHWQQTELQ
ncbi:hypothetical protein L4D20_18725 [Vibrio kyushuensis]